jgi:hypothetical protein
VDFECEERCGPVACSCPGRHGVVDGEIDELPCGVFVGEMALRLDRLAPLAVEGFDRVGIPYETG